MSRFLTDTDLVTLQQQGIPSEEARRQWTLLKNPPQRIVLERPCTIGDGIEQLSSHESRLLVESHRSSLEQGRWLKFVPASGAASRMFAFQSEKDKQRFCESIRRFAFADRLESVLGESGQNLEEMLHTECFDALVQAVLGSDGLGYAEIPKGLVEFHRYQDRTRCPFEEHLLEALDSFGNGDGLVKSHFTVAPEHQASFDRRLEGFLQELGHDACQVGFSIQHPSTETIARAGDQLLRTEDGKPVLRPGGHGALIENLNDLQGDLIFVKNIDNIGHKGIHELSVEWIQRLGGYLIRLQTAVHQHLRSLRTGNALSVTAARDFVNLTFPGAVLPDGGNRDALQSALIRHLNRPLRVCGMVKNEDEPGGGPFWVRRPDGDLSVQIVETAEIDSQDEQQQVVLKQATHFNPVFMALAVHDERGEPYDLRRFVEDQRVIITEKPIDGRNVSVLERPGLWNGAMDRWNSVFVEVPVDIFSPVKTVFDLLRDEHQPSCSQRSATAVYRDSPCMTPIHF